MAQFGAQRPVEFAQIALPRANIQYAISSIRTSDAPGCVKRTTQSEPLSPRRRKAGAGAADVSPRRKRNRHRGGREGLDLIWPSLLVYGCDGGRFMGKFYCSRASFTVSQTAEIRK